MKDLFLINQNSTLSEKEQILIFVVDGINFIKNGENEIFFNYFNFSETHHKLEEQIMKYLESKIKEKVMERSTVEENSLTSLLNKIFRSLIKQYEKLLVKEFGMNFINQVFSELNTKISNESNYVLLFLINSIFFLFGVCLKKNKNVSMVNSENSSHKGQILFFSMIKENYERILILTQNKNYGKFMLRNFLFLCY